jgi:hypothetical protein
MADETVRDIVRRVRTSLQEKGPAGAFLLAELDGAISRGVDLTARPKAGRTASAEEVSGRRSPNEAELLEMLSSVFETYLVTLPAVTESLNVHLRERYQVNHCEIDIDRSLLGDELQATGRARVEAAIPSPPSSKVKDAISEIGRIARERMI